MKLSSRAVAIMGRAGVLSMVLLGTARAQETAPEPPKVPEAPDVTSKVQETGGRLVISGETVVVTGEEDAPPRQSSVATKIETPLVETPRSMSIIDRRTLDEMAAISITQAHDYAVGITLLDERGPAFARGFPVDFYDLRRDGLRTYSWSVREPVAVDRVQYLRGSASVLYGDGSPGALVNMVLKKPLPIRRFELGASGGSGGFGRFTADLTGPLGSGSGVRYRVVAAAEWLDSGFQNDERRLTLLPSLAIDIGARGTLTLDTELYDQRGRNYRHVVPATAATQTGDFSGFPWDLSINSPDYGWTGGNVSPGLRLDVGLGERSSLHVAGRYTKIDGDIDGQGMVALAPDGRTAIRIQYHEVSTWHEYQSDTFVATTVRTGGLEHRIVLGVEAGLSTADSQIGIGPATPLDILAPSYPRQPEPQARPTKYDVSRLGFYAVDQLRPGKRLVIVPGLRWSRLALENKVAAAGQPSSTESVVSPSLGVVFLARGGLSLYANYAQGFEPPAPGQYLEDGQPLAPAENASLEAGIKADLLGRRLSLSGAFYGIRRTNVPEADARGFYRQIGEGESRGVELELVGSLARGLGMRGGYSWTSTEITRDTSGFAGLDLPNAPRHKAELWTRYRATGGPLKRLTLAGGLVYVSERFTARDNRVVIPAYTRLDATATCELAGPRLVLGVVGQNLTNRRYVTSGAGSVFFAGPPRRIAAQLTSAF